MVEVFLFDWGDTLMVDFPGVPGKMCDWETVEAVDGAEEALAYISKKAKIYIATGAAESSEADIKAAFCRVDIDKHVTGYFCQSNLGVGKNSPEFFPRILTTLGINPNQVTMVGDNLEKDIEPAIALGINAIWLSNDKSVNSDNSFHTIISLRELCLWQRGTQ